MKKSSYSWKVLDQQGIWKKKKKLEIGWYECQTDVFYLEYFAGGLPHPKVNKKI